MGQYRHINRPGCQTKDNKPCNRAGLDSPTPKRATYAGELAARLRVNSDSLFEMVAVLPLKPAVVLPRWDCMVRSTHIPRLTRGYAITIITPNPLKGAML